LFNDADAVRPMMSLALRNVAVCFAHSEIICSANCEFDASHQVNVKQSLTAADVFHICKAIFHIEDISLVPKERISLKKARNKRAFFWCGRPDLNRYGVTTEGF
jgi:hypothetical protein